MLTVIKRFLIVLGFILVAISIATKILNTRIQQALQERGITSENLSLNLFNRSALIENVTYQKRSDSIHIDQLALSSFRILKFLTRNKVELGEVIVINPTVIRTGLADTTQEKTTSNTAIEEILIHSITLSHLDLKVLGESKLETTADIELIDLKLTRKLIPSLKSMSALLENFAFTPKDSLHTIHLQSLSINSSTDSIRVDSLQVSPNYSKAAFGKKAGFQTDRLEINIPSILVSGFSGCSLRDSLVSITRIVVPSSHISVFRDKRQPFNENQRKDLPSDLLRKLPLGLIIDSILIRDTHIVYEEQPEASEKPFEIIFAKLHASMSDINTTTKGNKKYATLLASANLMNDGLIDAKFQIPMQDKIPHTATGSVSNLRLASLNPILTNVGRITIEKGTLEELQFVFSYDPYRVTGNVDMKYKDFGLKVLKASNKKDETLSSLINLVINNNKVQTKHGLIDIERDRKRFVFNLWWKALSDGIKNSINPLKSDKRK